MNERAFNLFTALLALILIILTSVLVTSMVNSESNTKTIIAKLIGQSKLEATSRLIRADAFQTFNYMMRDQIEGWLSQPDNVFKPLDYHVWEDWQKVKDEFADVQFKNEAAFASYLGQNLPSQLESYNDNYSGSYKINVDFNREGFVRILQSVVKKSAADNDFFEVVDCDGTPEGCPNGTFYINLKFSRLTPEMYESMPLLTVTDVRSGRQLKDPVLPRNDLKVFVPLRLFRALAITRAFMHSKLGPEMNGQEDYGFYSPRIHNEIDSMALGLCDYGSCYPREDPYFPSQKRYIPNHLCPGYLNNQMKVKGSFRGTQFEYWAGRSSNTRDVLRKLVKKRLCDLSNELISAYNAPGEFEVKQNSAYSTPCYIRNAKIEIASTPSKIIKQGAGSMVPAGIAHEEPNHADNRCPFSFTLDEPGYFQQRKIGMYKEGTELKMPGKEFGAEICAGLSSEESEENRKNEAFLESCSGGNKSWSCCTEVTGISFVLSFEEKDANYKVNKARDVTFNIGTVDYGYTPFNPNYDFGLWDQSCALGPLQRTAECDASGWTCHIPVDGSLKCYS